MATGVRGVGPSSLMDHRDYRETTHHHRNTPWTPTRCVPDEGEHIIASLISTASYAFGGANPRTADRVPYYCKSRTRTIRAIETPRHQRPPPNPP